MGKIVYILGKSASGKDTVYKELLKVKEFDLKPIVLYTTRPMRDGEEDGREYFFIDEDRVKKMESEGLVIEKRVYDTVYGPWTYLTANIGLDGKDNYIAIGTLESFVKIRDYYGDDKVLPIYLEVEDGVRLKRAIDRECTEDKPRYEELCRRFLADCRDFSEEKLNMAGIERFFDNTDFGKCFEEVKNAISVYLSRGPISD